jgi:hypothetical protein
MSTPIVNNASPQTVGIDNRPSANGRNALSDGRAISGSWVGQTVLLAGTSIAHYANGLRHRFDRPPFTGAVVTRGELRSPASEKKPGPERPGPNVPLTPESPANPFRPPNDPHIPSPNSPSRQNGGSPSSDPQSPVNPPLPPAKDPNKNNVAPAAPACSD